MTNTPPPNRSLRKIVFKLVQDSDGYPPTGYESVWAELLPDGTYRILNFPWYTYQAAYHDIVAAKQVDDELFFDKLLVESGNTLLRVIMDDADQREELRETLKKYGCDTEGGGPGFFSVNVPRDVVYAPIRALLLKGQAAEAWTFEEAVLCHDPHPPKAALQKTKRRPKS